MELPCELPLPYGFAVQPYLREIMDRATREPLREVTIYKGCSVGPTTAALENVVDYSLPYTPAILDEAIQFMVVKPRARNVAEVAYGLEGPSDPCAFATMTDGDAARESQWTTSNSTPLEDILSMVEADSTPAAEAARRRDREFDLRRLARLWELAGYGHLLPPEYRSET